MATIPAYKPQTPFVGLIPGGFRPSLMIRMKGKMTSKRGRCIIDFVNSATLDVEQDIMFHISIRMDEKVIVRNSYKNKYWEGEERYGAFRISYYDSFEIVILAEFQHYKIAINGVHLGVFRHRLPLNLVQFIHVKGDVDIEHILFEQDVKSAQEQEALGYVINNASSLPAGTQFRIGNNMTVQPAFSNHLITSSTIQYPSSVTVYPAQSTVTVLPANQSSVFQPFATICPPSNSATVIQSTGTSYPTSATVTVMPTAPQYQPPPSYSAQHVYPTLPIYPNQPGYCDPNQNNIHGATTSNPNEPPPPYQQNPEQQQNSTWLATPFFGIERRDGHVVFKTSKSEKKIKI